MLMAPPFKMSENQVSSDTIRMRVRVMVRVRAPRGPISSREAERGMRYV